MAANDSAASIGTVASAPTCPSHRATCQPPEALLRSQLCVIDLTTVQLPEGLLRTSLMFMTQAKKDSLATVPTPKCYGTSLATPCNQPEVLRLPTYMHRDLPCISCMNLGQSGHGANAEALRHQPTTPRTQHRSATGTYEYWTARLRCQRRSATAPADYVP